MTTSLKNTGCVCANSYEVETRPSKLNTEPISSRLPSRLCVTKPECCHTTTSYPNFGTDCCICSKCCTNTRRRQPTATKLHRGFPTERTGVHFLPFPRPPAHISRTSPGCWYIFAEKQQVFQRIWCGR